MAFHLGDRGRRGGEGERGASHLSLSLLGSALPALKHISTANSALFLETACHARLFTQDPRPTTTTCA